MKINIDWVKPPTVTIDMFPSVEGCRTEWYSYIKLAKCIEESDPYLSAWQIQIFHLTISIWWKSKKRQFE